VIVVVVAEAVPAEIATAEEIAETEEMIAEENAIAASENIARKNFIIFCLSASQAR
jgi:hypothetical protein